MPEIKVRKADGRLSTMIVDEEFVEKMHNNWKSQQDNPGNNGVGKKEEESNMDKSTIMEALETINEAILEKNDDDTTAEDFYWWNAVLAIFDCRVNRCGTIVPGPWIKNRTVDEIRRMS